MSISSLWSTIINFINNRLRKTNSKKAKPVLFLDNFLRSIDDLNVNKTVINIINDCNNKIHFTDIYFQEYSSELNNQFISIIKNLNENIYKPIFKINSNI